MNSDHPSFIEESLYKDILRSIPVLTIDLVILDQNTKKFILVRRANEPMKGEYMTPGGRIAKHEKAVEAAVRICEEEIGLTIHPLNWKFMGFFEGVWPSNAFNIENCKTHTLSLLFYSTLLVDSSSIKLDEQSDSFKLSEDLPFVISNSSYTIPLSLL